MQAHTLSRLRHSFAGCRTRVLPKFLGGRRRVEIAGSDKPPQGLSAPTAQSHIDKPEGSCYNPNDIHSCLPRPGEGGLRDQVDGRAVFEVPTVSLHVHERIDPRTIIEAVRKRNGEPDAPGWEQLSMFGSSE